MSKGLKYYRNKLLALRNAIDLTLEEMDKEVAPTPPRQRRNLMEVRKQEIETAIASGTWRKPKELRKTKSR